MSPVQREQKAQVIVNLEQIAVAIEALRALLRDCCEALKTLDDYVLGGNLLKHDGTLAQLVQSISAAALKARSTLAK